MSQLKIKNGNTWEVVGTDGVGVPSGGSIGQILQKNSGTNYDTSWTAIDTLPVDCLFGGTAIPSNSNLNDTTYLVPGNYTSRTDANTITLSNIPEGLTEAFMLRVYAPLDTSIQNASVVTGTWKYRLQEIHSMYGNKIWRRFCHIDSTADVWTIENWRLITVQDGIYIVSTAPSSASPDGLYFVVSSSS